MSACSLDVLHKFARFFAQLFRSSHRRACYILRIFYSLLRRLGSVRVRFHHCTYSARKLHEELRPAICASGLPTIHTPVTDDDRPDDRPLRTLAIPVEVASPQHPLHLAPPSRYSFHAGTVDDDQGPNAIVGSGQSQIDLENTSAQEPQSFFAEQDSTPRKHINLVSIIPTDVKRYDRNIKMKWAEPKPIVIDPKDNKYVEQVQHGWHDFVHPEGPRVYYHPERRILTDADMRLGKIDSKMLLAMADALKAHAKSQPEVWARIDDETELVLELELETGSRNRINSCGYYFVHHAKRMIFWAHKYTCEPGGEVLFNVKGAKKHSHIKYSLEAQYWLVLSKRSVRSVNYFNRLYHCELYPHNRYLSKQIFEELKEIIIHANAETITTDTSLAPFDGNELAKMLDLMDRVEGSIDKTHAHSVCVVARFMRLFTKVKYMNFCGQPGGRVDADRSIYYKEGHERETLIFRVSNLIFWYAPRKHYKRIRRVWVDEIINAPRWKDFITQLDNEWTGFTLYSTVMLAVDVSFLAVPGVIDINSYESSQTSSNIAVYMSALCSVGSLVVSLLLVAQSQDYQRQTAEGGAMYMSLMTSAIPGVENLALMHSLPFALLIWAMVFFGLALSLFIFDTSDVVTLATMVPGWTIVTIFTLWPMMTTSIGWSLDFVRSLAYQAKEVIQYLRDSRHSEEDRALRTRDRVA